MSFTRTPAGLSEKWRFHQVPTIWVEGPTDIYFYEPVTEKIPCRIEAYHGCENAKALVQALVDHDYPFLVILDGDYEILKPAKSPHRCVVILARYSFENFLWEYDAVNRACLRHARCGEHKDLVGPEMDRVARHLKKELLHAVALDIAARRSPSPPPVLPEAMEPLALNSSDPVIDATKVFAVVSRVETQLDPAQVSVAKAEVRAFLATRCMTHLLKGHIVFGILKRLFLRAAESERGKNSPLSNDAFTQILCDMVWRRCSSDDHRRLKRLIRTKTRKLVTSYPAQGRPAASSGL